MTTNYQPPTCQLLTW